MTLTFDFIQNTINGIKDHYIILILRLTKVYLNGVVHISLTNYQVRNKLMAVYNQ